MHNLHEIERYISEGFVLDWSGNWRPMIEVVTEESNYLHHLENGEIVDNGRWVKIESLLEAGSTYATGEHMQAETRVKDDLLETKVIRDILEKTTDRGDNALLDEIRGEIEGVLNIDSEEVSSAVESNNEKVNQEQVSKKVSPEIKESAEKETKEIEKVDTSNKTDTPSEILDDKADSFEAMLPSEESKDNGDLDTKSLRIAKPEEPATAQGKPSDTNKADSSSSEWDKAQSRMNKLIIIPIAAAVVIAIIVIVIVIL